jgi:ABC-type bacteriocin/lantibiotic exporter with double-glycine peptidase domain
MKRFNQIVFPFPFIKQTGFMECGTTCLAMIFKYYGYYDIRGFLTERAGVNTEGIDLYTLSELAEGFGFETDGYKIAFENLTDVHLPCIAHYEGNHFVVIYKANAHKVWISDPAIGRYELTKEEMLTRWNGIVLALNPTSDIFKNNELSELVETRRSKQRKLFRNFYIEPLFSSKKKLFQILIATLCLQILGLALPFFTQAIIDQVLVNENLKLLYAILAGMIVVFTTQVMLTFGRNILLTNYKVTFERAFFSRFFDHFIRLKQSYFDNHKREDFINRFQENLKIRQALNPSILESVIDLLFVSGYLLVLFFYSRPLGIISVVFVGLYILFTIIFTPRLKNLENQIFSENLKSMGHFLDTLLGIQTVRLLGIEKLKYWKWKNQYTKALNKVIKTEKTYIGLSTLLRSIFFASQAIIYWYGAFLTFNDQLTIGQYIAFITIFTIIINSLSRISHLWFIFTELSVTFDRLNDVLIQEPINYFPEDKIIIHSPFNVKFENVNFKYRPQDEKLILNNIQFEIKPGEFIGIAGRNGSGKTTLIKLLSKIYETYEGRILINDVELKNIQLGYLRRNIAVIPQDTYLFDGTIKENILYGNPGATDEEVIEAAILANAHEFIKDQYLGYNLKIGENGVNLSGGEKLKIAFARLFLTHAEIIILDEASSSLDIETEQIIMDNIKRKFKDKIIISIAHRLTTLKDADQIIILDKGAIAEVGSHEQLIKNNGLYKKFMSTYVQY